MKTHLIYHRKDADGILSAAIVCSALKLDPTNSFLYGVDHPEPCPLFDYRSTAGPNLKPGSVSPSDRIIIVDFSYPLEEMEAMLLHENVTLYDHHQTALDDLNKLLPALPHWVIDPTRAACQIVWDELMPELGLRRPWWVDAIGWRDLGGPWQPGADPLQSQEANILNTALFSFAPLNPYDLAAEMHNGNVWQKWYDAADALSQANQAAAKAIAQAVPLTLAHFPAEPEHLEIPIMFNVHPAMQSDVCHQLMQIHKRTVACVCNRSSEAPHHFTFSFRSTSNGPNVGQLASRFPRGGGHPRAAGCTLPTLPMLSYPNEQHR
jgi:hypothetical protein